MYILDQLESSGPSSCARTDQRPGAATNTADLAANHKKNAKQNEMKSIVCVTAEHCILLSTAAE